MTISTFQVTPFAANCFVIADEGEALVIDPGEVTEDLARCLREYRVETVVNTHGHCDHCGGNAQVLADTGARLVIHEQDLPLLRSIQQQGAMFGAPCPASPEPDGFLQDGDVITAGPLELEVRFAPGHSPGHVVLVGDGLVFTGDVLFAGSIGRTDLTGGNHQQLLESIRSTLLSLPDETQVYSGHGPVTTIGAERRGNPFLVGL